MSQAVVINTNAPSTTPDFIVKSDVIMSEIKRDIQDSNPADKTRRGKKTELMPADSKVANLQPQQPNDDPVNGTSIWFLLANLYVNNLLQTNQLEMSADAIALRANQNAMNLVQQGYSQLNDKLDQKTTQNSHKAHHFLGGMLGAGIGAYVLGAIVVAVAIAATGGLAAGPLLAGIALASVGIAVTITGGATYAEDKKDPGSVAMISSLIDNSIDDPGLLQKNQALASSLSSLGTTVNNDTSKNTQDLQNINSLEQQYSSMFSQMMNYYNASVRAS